MLRSIRHPVETLRTAPVQIASIIGTSAVGATCASIAMESSEPVAMFTWAGAALNIGAAVVHGVKAHRRIALRNRLESSLEARGFEERVMERTVRAYCIRQAALVACENEGYREEYLQLCQQNVDTMQFSWLPQV